MLQGYVNRQAKATSVDSDQMPQNAASGQCLHYLPLHHLFLDTSKGSKMNSRILGQLW